MRPQQTDDVRASMKAFMAARGLKVSPWCRKARVRESSLRGFLSGRSETVDLSTLQALAAAEGVGVAALIGEAPARDAAGRRLLDPATVRRVARWVLSADRELDQQRSVDELAETIATFAATEPSGDLDFWENKLREQVEAAVSQAVCKPSVDD